MIFESLYHPTNLQIFCCLYSLLNDTQQQLEVATISNAFEPQVGFITSARTQADGVANEVWD